MTNKFQIPMLIIFFAMSAASCGAKNAAPHEEEIAEIEEVDIIEDGRGNEEIIVTDEIILQEEKPVSGEKEYDFSDLSHWNLTVSAWEKLAEKDYEGVSAFANKCLEIYEAEARETAKTMRKFAGPGREDDYAVVNDVAACRYIMGEAYMKRGLNDKALEEFNLVIEQYPYAQCWDPKGWFWKVAEVSRKNIEKIEKLAKGAQ